MYFRNKDGELMIPSVKRQDHDDCPKCGNKIGFAFGTCSDCGFNHYDYEYRYIKVDVDMLNSIPENIKNYLIKQHDKSIDFRNTLWF